MEKIWIVKHCEDNGESYEDHCYWENSWMFSSWNKAYTFYCERVLSEYTGEYKLIVADLDTGKELDESSEVLDTSPWGGYTNYYYEDDGYFSPEEEDGDEDCYCPEEKIEDPESDLMRWRYPNAFIDSDENIDYSEELNDERSYLQHSLHNYFEWKECEEELQKRVKEARLESLSLEDLLRNLNDLLK